MLPIRWPQAPIRCPSARSLWRRARHSRPALCEELSATINEIEVSAKANADAARDAKAKSDMAAGQVQISNEHMHEMHQAMEDIYNGQLDTEKIIETIENIAFPDEYPCPERRR